MQIVADYYGVNIPDSEFLNEKRISRLQRGIYESHEVRGALHVVRSSDVVMELGTGIGAVGAATLINAKPERLVSYEGNPTLLPVIQKLYAANNLTSKVALYNRILLGSSDRPATIPFNVHNSYLGSSLTIDREKKGYIVEVPTGDFNAALAEHKPDVLLMDIESGELEILQNTTLNGVRAIVIEFHPKIYGVAGMRTCKNALRSMGFEAIPDLSTRKVWVAERSG